METVSETEITSSIELTTSQPQHRIDVGSPSRGPFPNLPPTSLIDGSREDYINICVPLYKASISGDWATARAFFDKRPELLRCSITENCDTPLHVAASAENTKSMGNIEKYVENLVNCMEKQDLELENKNSNTPFCLAAASGNVRLAEIMVRKNKGVLDVPGSNGMMPLYMAALFAKRDMVHYLYRISTKMHGDFWTPQNRGWVLIKCVESDIFDVALNIVKDHPELIDSRGVVSDVLFLLAQKPDAFRGTQPHTFWRIIASIAQRIVGLAEKESDALRLLRAIWTDIMKLPQDEIRHILKPSHGKKIPMTSKGAEQDHPSRAQFVAAQMGNSEFVVELIRQYPDVIWKVNDEKQSIFHVAVLHRQECIYGLLHEIGSKELITAIKDSNGNNMLHLAGKIPTTKRPLNVNVSGAALQMQRELLWFKEVEAMIPPCNRQKKNKDGLTPYEIFTEEHHDLASKGEEWMKATSAQCMVVAALIAIIVFAIAFTVPGGYHQQTGVPVFQQHVTFKVFVLSDAVSLVLATASILTCLSILTSPYTQLHFLHTLPNRLMIALATLFLSITAMMVAFSVSFFILYHDQLIWVPILISILAATPVALYARLQYPLLADVYRSTYGSKHLFKPKKHTLFY